MPVRDGRCEPARWSGLLFLLFFFLVAGDVQAQSASRADRWRQLRLQKAQRLHPYRPGRIEAMTLFVEENRVIERLSAGYKGFHPVIGGVSTGSGFGVGLSFSQPQSPGATYFTATGAITVLGYRLLRGTAGYGRGPWFVRGYAWLRDFPRETYFGLGPNSAAEARTNYSVDDRTFGGVIGARPGSGVLLAAEVSHFDMDLGPGENEDVPSIEQLFRDDDTPGLTRQPGFVIFGGRLVVDTRNLFDFWDIERRYAPTVDPLAKRSGNPDRGSFLSFAVTRYLDQDDGEFDFLRYEVEIQQYLRFNHGHRMLAFRHFSSFSHADEDARVPFYLMRTIGGPNSLRGFRDFRFRDRHALLFNLEYRWQAWSGLDGALFADAGKVFSRTSGWNLRDLETSYGVGLRFNTAGSVLMRIDLARSREGARLNVKVGQVF